MPINIGLLMIEFHYFYILLLNICIFFAILLLCMKYFRIFAASLKSANIV